MIYNKDSKLISKNGLVKVVWVNSGDGKNGQYVPFDPDDTNYLRFRVSFRRQKNQQFAEYEGDHLTLMPADTDEAILQEGLQHILNVLESETGEDLSVEAKCDLLSMISPSWFIRKRSLKASKAA